MLGSSIEGWEESWKILRNRPFALYITLSTCIGLAFLGYYTGTIVRLLCIQDDLRSLLKEVFLGPSIVWSLFGAAIACWTNGYPAETICVADSVIFTGGTMINVIIVRGYDDAQLFIAKLFVGVGIGMISMACPRYYISHGFTSTRIRGSLVRLHCFCFAIGKCLSLSYGLFATTQIILKEETKHHREEEISTGRIDHPSHG
ncbi:hypothetical protein C5167_028435 [Papaver somniferum]|nr:hypothetical protein C5167_028435 [Papaver somniferum]